MHLGLNFPKHILNKIWNFGERKAWFVALLKYKINKAAK